MTGKPTFAAMAGLLALSFATTAATADSGGNVCADGRLQSPINIEGADGVIMHRLDPAYSVAPLSMLNDRHTVRFLYPGGSLLAVGPRRFELKGFHFHTPAEHTVMGANYPMEIHLVHEDQAGNLAVVAVMVREGRANLAAEELWPSLPLEPDMNSNRAEIKINARDFLPTDLSYYRYMGSLTTPPCTEGVNWYVLKKPVEFSAQQIAMIKGIMGENARPLQARNNRIILDAQPQ